MKTRNELHISDKLVVKIWIYKKIVVEIQNDSFKEVNHKKLKTKH